MTYKGECFCGAIRIEVTGDPEGMGYCHCRSCRSWSGGLVNAFTLWKPDAVRVTTGVEHLGTFQKTPMSERQYCRQCGGHLLTRHPQIELIDVFAATIPGLSSIPRFTSTIARPYFRCGMGSQSLRISRLNWAGPGNEYPSRKTAYTQPAPDPKARGEPNRIQAIRPSPTAYYVR